MATVHLLSAAPSGEGSHPKAALDLEQMRESAAADSFRAHSVVDDPAESDVILFVETSTAAGAYFEHVRAHPVYREFRARSYLFSATDRIVPFLPGIYASLERRWQWRSWTRAGHYLGVKEEGMLVFNPNRRPSRLFSFVGAANTHPVRARIMELQSPEALLIDSYAESLAIRRGERDPLPDDEFLERYVRGITDSAFVLCPRGRGTSSFRLFETMMLGRVPVILADDWVAPTGPDWGACSLRVREAEVSAIPALLESRADDAAAMGRAAREVWADWFSPAASFHRSVESCLDLMRFASSRTGPRALAPRLQMLRPYHAARWLKRRVRPEDTGGGGRRFRPKASGAD